MSKKNIRKKRTIPRRHKKSEGRLTKMGNSVKETQEVKEFEGQRNWELNGSLKRREKSLFKCSMENYTFIHVPSIMRDHNTKIILLSMFPRLCEIIIRHKKYMRHKCEIENFISCPCSLEWLVKYQNFSSKENNSLSEYCQFS